MRRSLRMRIAAAAAAAVVVGIVSLAVLSLPDPPSGLAGVVRAAGERSAVQHPVTSVLLEFRAWDTFLEVGVLLLAVIGASALAGLPRAARSVAGEPVEVPLVWLVRLVVPGLVLAAGHVLLLGASAPGGAFHAGALLAAAAVLLELGGYTTVAKLRAGVLRALWAAGFAAFLLAGFVAVAGGRRFLELPQVTAAAWILFIEAAVGISIGVGLVSLFLAARAAGGER